MANEDTAYFISDQNLVLTIENMKAYKEHHTAHLNLKKNAIPARMKEVMRKSYEVASC